MGRRQAEWREAKLGFILLAAILLPAKPFKFNVFF
jgi:hypothetical protein